MIITKTLACKCAKLLMNNFDEVMNVKCNLFVFKHFELIAVSLYYSQLFTLEIYSIELKINFDLKQQATNGIFEAVNFDCTIDLCCLWKSHNYS